MTKSRVVCVVLVHDERGETRGARLSVEHQYCQHKLYEGERGRERERERGERERERESTNTWDTWLAEEED